MTNPTASELNTSGAELHKSGDFLGARLHYQAALKVDPNYLPALANMAVLLSADNNLAASEACLRRIVAIAPRDGSQWNNFGNILMRAFKYGEAEGAFNNAAELTPDDPGTWHNLALLMSRMGRYDEALDAIERAKALGTLSSGIENDLAITLLHKGDDFASALAAYEKRWEVLPHSQAWDFHIPEWQGEDLHGKRLLFHAEQGYGDTLMTARFVPALEARGALVTSGVLPGMVRLFEAQGWRALNLFTFDADDAKDFDYQTPMFSAMRWLGIEQRDLSGKPYLKAPAVISAPIPRSTFNIGICWASGRRENEADWRRRQVPLENFLQLASVPGVALYSLQAGPDALDIARCGAEVLINDQTLSLNDWADTAALVAKLDLVISVDTAVAHLSAAMGKPTWMLAQYMHCWRWWDIARGTGKPWYDSMRILKQSSPFKWESLLDTCHQWLVSEVKQERAA